MSRGLKIFIITIISVCYCVDRSRLGFRSDMSGGDYFIAYSCG